MLNYSANGPSGYNLTNSLRFRASASAYLNRTPASAGNRKTWTWSAWLKRGTLTSTDALFNCNGAVTNTTYFLIRFESSGALYIGNASTNFCITTQVFRDPSAWYHLVITLDTTQATATNRLRVYVNGVEVTAFSSDNRAAQIAQNSDQGINQASPHNIGRENSGVFYFDGYMDEINFIDGQALTPSSFGSTNSITGVWQPARYTGTYGTNGFYLNFTDIALTSGSNTGLGKDFSGNGNFWNTNNISVTAGVTYDAMSDVPTLTSTTVGNYCTWNPVAGSINTLSNGNLTYSGSTGGDYQRNGTLPVSSGKWYYETVITTFTGPNADMYIGFSETSNILNNSKSVGIQANQYSINNYASGTFITKVTNGSFTITTMTTAVAGDVLMCALDLDNNRIWFGKNGTWIDSGNPATGTTPTFSGVTAGTYVPGVTLSGAGVLVTLNSNFGQRPFTYTPPTGFNAWNTFNLPTSAVVKGNSVMDATLYTGNGSAQTIVNQGQFRPDFVWIKARSNAFWHQLYDASRGVQQALYSNATNAELTETTGLTAFNSNGFTVSSGSGVNENASTFVGWQWQAGSSAVTNTSGTISSQVRANTTAGFSVVTYTGTGANATVGHGLGVAPRMIICKNRASATDWAVYHASVGNTGALRLNLTAVTETDSRYWNNTTPTSTVFSIGSSSTVNGSSNLQVAYCFAEIAGFSRFGSYTGNGSTDGTFVYTGFRPKYVMIKVTSTTEDWYIWDTSRGTFNANTPILYADLSAAESSSAIDTLSNGFKCRTAQTLQNANGATYIYMAFAENPFKNALAR